MAGDRKTDAGTPTASGSESGSGSRQGLESQRELDPKHAFDVIRESEFSVRNSLHPPELMRRQAVLYTALAVLGLITAWQPGNSLALNVVWAVAMVALLIVALVIFRRFKAATSALRDEARSGVRRANASSDRQVNFGLFLVLMATFAVTLVKGVPMPIQYGALALGAALFMLILRRRLPDEQQTPLRLFRFTLVLFAAFALAVATNHLGQGFSIASVFACAISFWLMARHRSHQLPYVPEEHRDEIRHTF